MEVDVISSGLALWEQPEDAARFCAVQWAQRIYPLRHAASRYVCMLGCGDSKLEIRLAKLCNQTPSGNQICQQCHALPIYDLSLQIICERPSQLLHGSAVKNLLAV